MRLLTVFGKGIYLMANPHPDEQVLYGKIRDEEIKVPLVIWDLIYRYLGDEISAITQITVSYHRYNEVIPVSDAKKILEHIKKINVIIRKILHHDRIENENEKLDELKNYNTPLHPVINELFFHYIGNDVYGINMIVSYHLDPLDESPIPVEEAQKILNKTFTMKQFMDRLREATHQEVKF